LDAAPAPAVPADLRVRQAITSEPSDLLLLRRELHARLGAALAYLLAGGQQLPAGAFGERLHADREEQVAGSAKLLAYVATPARAAQPLPVEKVRAGELRREPGPAQPVDRFPVELLGGGGVAQQGPRARLDGPCASRWHFDEATFDRTAQSFDNGDHVAIVIHNYRWRLGLAEGEPEYDDLERRLAEGPVITVPAITLEGDPTR
jgi:hypothetical protein